VKGYWCEDDKDSRKGETSCWWVNRPGIKKVDDNPDFCLVKMQGVKSTAV
jgi:hypothetical protein